MKLPKKPFLIVLVGDLNTKSSNCYKNDDSLSYQAQIQLLKEVSQTKFQGFPLQLSEYHDIPSLLFVLR